MSKTNDNNRKYSDKQLIKKLYPYLKPEMPKFIIALSMTLILVLLDLVGPRVQGSIIGILSLNDESFIENYGFFSDKFTAVSVFAAIYGGALIISGFLNYISAMMLQRIGQRMIYNLRQDIFIHIESLSIAQINKQPIGKFVTRVTNDTNALSNLFTNVIVNLIKYTLTMIAVMVAMFIVSWQLALLMLAIMPVIAGASFIFRFFSRRAYKNVRNNISDMNAYLYENISGIKVTQIFNQEGKVYKQFDVRNKKLKKASINEIFVFSIFRPLIYGLFVFSQALVLYVGSVEIKKGILAIDGLVAFYAYISSFFNPIQNLAEQFNALQSAFASVEKIYDVLDTKIEILDKEDAIVAPRLKGEIEFKHVWFAYNDDNWILKDVSFKVNAKETVALVGATGAGKTTILSLIVRNYDIQKGEILIDGRNIKDYTVDSLRKNIGQMLQDVFLFSGTIRDNIVLRSEGISDEEIKETCKYVNADTFIEKLDDGLDHKVEERGLNFSQGQRQLLSFARTLVHKPNIMILDEATANIDTETEKIIQDSLEKMMSIGTMLIVAHRLSTIQHADKIIVLHHGEIKEMGNHQELLKKRGLYYSLYELQYKHLENN